MLTHLVAGVLALAVAGCVTLFGWPLDPWRAARWTYFTVLALAVIGLELGQ